MFKNYKGDLMFNLSLIWEYITAKVAICIEKLSSYSVLPRIEEEPNYEDEAIDTTIDYKDMHNYR